MLLDLGFVVGANKLFIHAVWHRSRQAGRPSLLCGYLTSLVGNICALKCVLLIHVMSTLFQVVISGLDRKLWRCRDTQPLPMSQHKERLCAGMVWLGCARAVTLNPTVRRGATTGLWQAHGTSLHAITGVRDCRMCLCQASMA